MVKVIAITAEWCGKCQQAKKKLEDYDIDWVDIDMDHRGLELTMKYDVTHLPTFLIFQHITGTINSWMKTESVLEVKRILDNVNAKN